LVQREFPLAFANVVNAQVVHDFHQPAAWIVYPMSASEVAKKAQEAFLDQIVGLRGGRSGQNEVPEEAGVMLLVKSTHIPCKLLFHPRI